MKSVLFAAVFAMAAACGGDDAAPTPFDQVACGSAWGSAAHIPPDTCDRACEDIPSNYFGSADDVSACEATGSDGSMLHCARSFSVDGADGCCHAYDGRAPNTPGSVVFFQCN